MVEDHVVDELVPFDIFVQEMFQIEGIDYQARISVISPILPSRTFTLQSFRNEKVIVFSKMNVLSLKK